MSGELKKSVVRKSFPELLRKIATHLTEEEIQKIDQKLHTGEWEEDQLSPLVHFVWELNIDEIELEMSKQTEFMRKKELLEIKYRDEIASSKEKYEMFLAELYQERRSKDSLQKESTVESPEKKKKLELHEQLKGKSFIEALRIMTSTLTEEEIQEYNRKVQTVGTDISQFPPGIQFVWRMFCKTIQDDEKAEIEFIYEKQLLELEFFLKKERLQMEHQQAIELEDRRFQQEKKLIDKQKNRELLWMLIIVVVIVIIYEVLRSI